MAQDTMALSLQSPRQNPDFWGHSSAEKTFLDAWHSGRMAHAWLLSGPKGVGKATFAYRAARFILSGGGAGGGLFGAPPGDLAVSCDDPVFRRVAAAAHGDLKVVERGWSDDKKTKLRTEIVVDDVRGVGAFMSLTAAEGGWRIVIIDSADDMNRNAANAILKTLEEPPRNALMILVSHSPARLLPTIRSRCRRLSFGPVDEQHVTAIVSTANPHLQPAELSALARLSEGSPGKALALAAEGGVDLYAELMTYLAGIPKIDIPALHDFAERLAKPDADTAWRTVTELLGWWLARLVRAGGTQGHGMQEVVPGESKVMSYLLGVGSLEQWLDVWEKVTLLFRRTDGVNLDRKQSMLVAFTLIERVCRA